jgi:hypothetical protein
MSFDSFLDFSSMYVQAKVHTYQMNTSFVISESVFALSGISLKVYTSIFSFYNLQFTYRGASDYLMTFGTDMTCSMVSTGVPVVAGGSYVFSCQSKSLIMGDIIVKIDRPTEFTFVNCSTQVVCGYIV